MTTFASEKELQDAARTHALACGWLVYHTYDSRRSDPGFPDTVMIRPAKDSWRYEQGPRIAVVEFKHKTKISPHQDAWLEAFRYGSDDVLVLVVRTDDEPAIERLWRYLSGAG